MDKAGATVDFRLSDEHYATAAKVFFKKAIRPQGHAPPTITLDGERPRIVPCGRCRTPTCCPKDTKLRSAKYLNNLVEQGHRGIKSRTRPMLGFKNINFAALTLAGVELLQHIRKGLFTLRRRRLTDQAALAVWNAVRAP